MLLDFFEGEIEAYGHASVRIENSDGFTVYIDPWSEVMKNTPKSDGELIISTHDHFDHFDEDIIENLISEDGELLCSEDSEDSVPKNIDYKIFRAGKSVKTPIGDVKGVHAYNVDKYRSEDEPYHPKGFCTGAVFNLEGVNFYHASDTGLISEMSDLKDEGIDVAFLPIGGKYTMNIEEAVEAVKKINPKVVVPIHYDVVDGTESNPEKFKRLVEEDTEAEVEILY